MTEYHKIQTCFKRDPTTKKIIIGDWTLPEFQYLKDAQWTFTEKVDGTNIRIIWDGTALSFGGRTNNAQIPVPLVNKLNLIFPNKDTFTDKFGTTPVTLYGEGYGSKIQDGSKYVPDGVDFVLFDVRIGDIWLSRSNVDDIAMSFGLRVTPIVGHGTLGDAVDLVRQGLTSTWGNFIAEGVIARPEVELRTQSGRRLITKIKHRDFHESLA